MIFLFSLLTGCEQQEWLSIDIPDLATNKYDGHPFSEYSKQTSYVHKSAYPNDTALIKIENNLLEEWQSCDYEESDWQDFEDISGATPKHIHQKIKTWKKNSNHLIFVTLRYESSSCNCCECKPDTDNQNVIVIEHQMPWWLFWENVDALCTG